MKLNNKSVNITKENLIENALRVLVESEKIHEYNAEQRTVLTRTAQGYLKAAELMNEYTYIHLGERDTDT